MRALVLLSLALLLAPPALAHSYAEARYIGSAGDVAGARACSGTVHMSLNVGGACELHVHAGTIELTVTDDALGPIAFAWDSHTPLGELCAVGNAEGIAMLVLETGCSRLTVIPELGATTGTIRARFI